MAAVFNAYKYFWNDRRVYIRLQFNIVQCNFLVHKYLGSSFYTYLRLWTEGFDSGESRGFGGRDGDHGQQGLNKLISVCIKMNKGSMKTHL